MMKRAQGATSAAVLVAIITILIVLYILFMPPEERAELLGENKTVTPGVPTTGNLTLLSEMPGRLDYIAQRELEHTIPTLNLRLWTEGLEMKTVDSLYVKKSLIGETKTNLTFRIASPADSKNIMLNFYVTQAKGRLIINLNGHEVFNREMSLGNIEPIKLDEWIAADNTLQFTVSSPGIAFWASNRYALENILITADVTQRAAQESKNIFIVTATEKTNLESASLRFLPYCEIGKVGKLIVTLNSYEVYSAVPDCNTPVNIDFAPYYLLSGENTLKFKTDLGNYILEQIRVKSKLRALEYPTYYFELSEEQYNAVQNNQSNINVYLRFVDDLEYKQGKILVNGHTAGIDQKDIDFEKNINSWIVRGNNAVKIVPERTLDIAELKVLLEKR